MSVSFVTIGGMNLEYRYHKAGKGDHPVLVFLHEGLGCVALWRDFPARIAERTGCDALVYSRAGYGNSSPVALPRPVRFMHDEATALGGLLTACGLTDVILVGHSDGASIALIYAGMVKCAGIRALVLEAPHVFVEPGCLESIAKIGEVYRTSDLRSRLEKHHGINVDTAFHGWNEVWLNPDFKHWNIEGYLPAIDKPVLVIQGTGDEYGTVGHIESIQRNVPGSVEVVMVPDCGHAPHREHPELTEERMGEFIGRVTADR